jgi:hypothetical protein
VRTRKKLRVKGKHRYSQTNSRIKEYLAFLRLKKAEAAARPRPESELPPLDVDRPPEEPA